MCRPILAGRRCSTDGARLSCLPADLIRESSSFGSTAVPGLTAKPIVDILVEVTSLEETRKRELCPFSRRSGVRLPLEAVIGRPHAALLRLVHYDVTRAGTERHHIHMVESHFEHWDRLLFRDYLVEHPDVALESRNLNHWQLARCASEGPHRLHEGQDRLHQSGHGNGQTALREDLRAANLALARIR